ncbi:MAG: nuclear transport factor 2 family protein [Deltaproteobacteria bacterium]|nr:nuclear transport factor 2 family protein [Deltaproteobacteria bacterium]MBW2360742.1 nuclear transport factor 2 family protein [Deltaproteobacteria bacterium]
MSNAQRVLDFIKTMEANNKADILSWFHADAVFHNIPMDPAVGHEQIWAALAPAHDVASEIDWVVHNIAEAEDGRVLTERTDRYCLGGHWAEFKVMGIFEFVDGKIQQWRDYFDLQQSLDSMNPR